MCLGSKSEMNDFILEDRAKIPLTLEHEVLEITIKRQRLRIILFHRKVMCPSQDIQAFIFLTIA